MKISDYKKSPEFAEFLGWHFGDGCISVKGSRHQYFLTGDLIEEQEFYKKVIIPRFNNLFEDKLKKDVSLRKYKSVGVCGIYVFDKKFVSLLTDKLHIKTGKKINISLPEYIKTNEQKINFLRGLFDTDGSIYFCRSNFKTKNKSLHNLFHYKPRIKIATISEPLISDVYDILIYLGFHPRMRKVYRKKKTESFMHGVVLYRKDDIKRYLELINFKNPKHKSKIQVAKKYGFCPPFTRLNERKKIIENKLDPLDFYKKKEIYSFCDIKTSLNKWV